MSEKTFDWKSIPLKVPLDYKSLIGCKIEPVSNNIIKIHGIPLCANKNQAFIKQHNITEHVIYETVSNTDRGGFKIPTIKSRVIKYCLTCWEKTRFFCIKDIGHGRKVYACMTYISYWDNLKQLVEKEKANDREKSISTR